MAVVTVDSQSLSGIVLSEDMLDPTLVKVQMQISGEKSNLILFLDLIEKTRTLIDVEVLVLEGHQDLEKLDYPPYSLKLNLVSYYFEDPNVADSTVEEASEGFSTADNVLVEIENMEYYEPRQSQIFIGKEDPFLLQ